MTTSNHDELIAFLPAFNPPEGNRTVRVSGDELVVSKQMKELPKPVEQRKFVPLGINKTREYMENPHKDIPYLDRLRNANAVDLTDNLRVIDHGNGFTSFVPIDPNKKWCWPVEQLTPKQDIASK